MDGSTAAPERAARPTGGHAGPDSTVIEPARTEGRVNGQCADGELPEAGEIWICKLGWRDKAPWDVRAYAAGHSTYPCDSTLQQLYDGAEFEAYHELGASAVVEAAKAGDLPLKLSRDKPKRLTEVP